MIIGQGIKRGAAKEKPSLTMGSTSSQKKPTAFTNFDTSKPIDESVAMTSMRDNKNLFYMILNRFRGQTLITHLNEIATSINQRNLKKLG